MTPSDPATYLETTFPGASDFEHEATLIPTGSFERVIPLSVARGTNFRVRACSRMKIRSARDASRKPAHARPRARCNRIRFARCANLIRLRLLDADLLRALCRTTAMSA